MPTGLQAEIEKQRAVYESLAKPLLWQMVKIHRLTIKELATIMGVHRNHMQAVVNHEVLPSLELAFKMARYFEVTVDDLFGWRFDDSGERRPLIVEVRGKVQRLNNRSEERNATKLAEGE